MRWSLIILRWSLILLISRPVYSQTPSSSPDYREIFGADYEYAVNTVENNTCWSDTLNKHNIGPHFALSVIFPELIRYSSISDFIEVKALEVLYVQYGHDYADFSIGLFQMKPTFAEQIEADILGFGLENGHPELAALHASIVDSLDIRRDRIVRLKNDHYQLLYLEAFIRIMDQLYHEKASFTIEEKLAFYAAAYNTGYRKGYLVIRGEEDKDRFYTGMVETDIKYNYSAIALFYHLKNGKK